MPILRPINPSIITRVPRSALRGAERLDLHVHTRRQVELHQGVDRFRRRSQQVQQALVRADLELLSRLLVDVRRAQHGPAVAAGGQRDRTRHVGAGAPRGVHDLGGRSVEDAVIVGLEADADLLVDHGPSRYLMISVTVPAPTVRPPSRIAKRSPLSIAIGVISSTSIVTLSPGITISIPAGRCADPVTSVVRK